jgi:uncharacterized protein (DUF433 family)
MGKSISFLSISRHRQFIKDFLDDRFAGFFLGLGFVGDDVPLGVVWQNRRLRQGMAGAILLGMSNEQLLARITTDPNICHGKPCVRGLRYPVDFLLDLLSSDMTQEQILADYPDLEVADLRAAIAYGARLSRVKSIEPLAA